MISASKSVSSQNMDKTKMKQWRLICYITIFMSLIMASFRFFILHDNDAIKILGSYNQTYVIQSNELRQPEEERYALYQEAFEASLGRSIEIRVDKALELRYITNEEIEKFTSSELSILVDERHEKIMLEIENSIDVLIQNLLLDAKKEISNKVGTDNLKNISISTKSTADLQTLSLGANLCFALSFVLLFVAISSLIALPKGTFTKNKQTLCLFSFSMSIIICLFFGFLMINI